jgi:hypothetical protein
MGVRIGERRKGGETQPRDIVLIVLVKEKLPPGEVQAEYLIPDEFQGMATDVVSPFGPVAPKEALGFADSHEHTDDMAFISFVTFFTDSAHGMPPQGGSSWYRFIFNDTEGIGFSPTWNLRPSYGSDVLRGVIFMNQGHCDFDVGRRFQARTGEQDARAPMIRRCAASYTTSTLASLMAGRPIIRRSESTWNSSFCREMI